MSKIDPRECNGLAQKWKPCDADATCRDAGCVVSSEILGQISQGSNNGEWRDVDTRDQGGFIISIIIMKQRQAEGL